MKILIACTFIVTAAGCYHSGSRQQDGWAAEVNHAEPELDLAQGEPYLGVKPSVSAAWAVPAL